MQRVARRLDRLGEIFNPLRQPHKLVRVVVSGVSGLEPLANSTCTRTLRNGTLFEIVDLGNSYGDLTDEELERFIQGFLIQEVGVGWRGSIR
jgi:hypothetical protein